MEFKITDADEINAVMQHRQHATTNRAIVEREVTALDAQKRMASEANSMTIDALSRSPQHQAALHAELARVLKTTGYF